MVILFLLLMQSVADAHIGSSICRLRPPKPQEVPSEFLDLYDPSTVGHGGKTVVTNVLLLLTLDVL